MGELECGVSVNSDDCDSLIGTLSVIRHFTNNVYRTSIEKLKIMYILTEGKFQQFF